MSNRKRDQSRMDTRKLKDDFYFKPADLTDDEKVASCEKFHLLKVIRKEFLVCPVPFCSEIFKNHYYLNNHFGKFHRKFPIPCKEKGCDSKFASVELWKSHQNEVHSKFKPIIDRKTKTFTVNDYLEVFNKGEIPYYNEIQTYYKRFLKQSGDGNGKKQAEVDNAESADEQVLEHECESCEQFKANIQEFEEEICDAGKLVEWQEEKIGNLKRENAELLKKLTDSKKIIEDQKEEIKKFEEQRGVDFNENDYPIDIEYKYNI